MLKTRTSATDYSNQNKLYKPLSYIKNVGKESFQLATTGLKTLNDIYNAQRTTVHNGPDKAPTLGVTPPKSKMSSAVGQLGGSLIGRKYSDKTGKQTNKGMK